MAGFAWWPAGARHAAYGRAEVGAVSTVGGAGHTAGCPDAAAVQVVPDGRSFAIARGNLAATLRRLADKRWPAKTGAVGAAGTGCTETAAARLAAIGRMAAIGRGGLIAALGRLANTRGYPGASAAGAGHAKAAAAPTAATGGRPAVARGGIATTREYPEAGTAGAAVCISIGRTDAAAASLAAISRSPAIADGALVTAPRRLVAAIVVVAVLVAGVVCGTAGSAWADDDPVTVTGDNRRSVDIRVRDEGPGAAGRTKPRRPTAADAPEAWDECHERNSAYGTACLAAAGGTTPRGDSVVTLALEARSRLTLPLPAPTVSPRVRFKDGRTGGLTGAPTWLWTDPTHWSPNGTPLVRSARAGEVSALVSAAPVRIVWHPGDGTTVVCRSPGTPLTDPRQGSAGSPDCGHTYRRTSADQPNARYRATVGITWAVTWSGSDGSGGTLAPLIVTTIVDYTVREARAQLTSP
ncbi:hypothetical protein GCM10009539_67850 [Cryptosporangium japonicum]|uniref:ATP/GTP-binding protein n=1 Tax=Cryptosporangium japonicum TaxID=80872 RepID=A0ABN0V1Z7_9ACTN